MALGSAPFNPLMATVKLLDATEGTIFPLIRNPSGELKEIRFVVPIVLFVKVCVSFIPTIALVGAEHPPRVVALPKLAAVD